MMVQYTILLEDRYDHLFFYIFRTSTTRGKKIQIHATRTREQNMPIGFSSIASFDSQPSIHERFSLSSERQSCTSQRAQTWRISACITECRLRSPSLDETRTSRAWAQSHFEHDTFLVPTFFPQKRIVKLVFRKTPLVKWWQFRGQLFSGLCPIKCVCCDAVQ